MISRIGAVPSDSGLRLQSKFSYLSLSRISWPKCVVGYGKEVFARKIHTEILKSSVVR